MARARARLGGKRKSGAAREGKKRVQEESSVLAREERGGVNVNRSVLWFDRSSPGQGRSRGGVAPWPCCARSLPETQNQETQVVKNVKPTRVLL